MSIHLFNRLIAIGIIDVGIDWPPRLSLVPLISDLFSPLPGRGFNARVAGRDDCLEKHEVMIGTERIGRIIGVLAINGLGGVAFVENAAACGEGGVAGGALFETVVDLVLSC